MTIKGVKMKFYAYKPDKQGHEPLGSKNRLLFEAPTIAGAVETAKRMFCDNCDNIVLTTYQNYYNNQTLKKLLKI